ncbi:MAG: hypothetical protein ACTHK8_13960 [Ginsengibacter sp.]
MSFCKKYNIAILLTIFFTVTASSLLAQGSEDSITTVLTSSYPSTHNTGSLSDFPKMHPLIVHVPIMFLILAALMQLASFFVFKSEFSWITLILLVIGFVGAYLSSGVFHGGDPNLKILDSVTRATFEKHEQYASYTVWISGIAAATKIISQFFLKRKMFPEIIVALLMVASAYTVAVAGDMGARLVHIDGIGVQGRYLPVHDDM